MSEISQLQAIGLSIFIGTLALDFLHKRLLRSQSKSVTVTNVIVYPIKSCKGINLKSAIISERGFLYDRLFMIVDEKGKFVSQRTKPKMCLIETNICWETNILTISAPSMKTSLQVSLMSEINDLPLIDVSVWGDPCTATEAIGDEGNQWFSEYLETPGLRFVRMHNECVRKTDPKFAPEGQVAFSDGYPFLLVSNSSVEALNKKLTKSVPFGNFRPNIVVDCEEAFAEDSWGDILFIHNDADKSSVEMSAVKPCSRCKVPTIDQQTAQLDPDNEPNRTLKQFHSGQAMNLQEKSWKGEVCFETIT